jgi:hypothetical protein
MWRIQTVMAGFPQVSFGSQFWFLSDWYRFVADWKVPDRPLDTSSCPTYDYWKEGLSNYTNTVSQSQVPTALLTDSLQVRCRPRRIGTRRRPGKRTLKDSTLRTWPLRRLRRLLDLCPLHLRVKPQRKILQLHQGVPCSCSKHDRLCGRGP